ncbi:serine/threonine-protein kinase [Gloeocapsopsis dulcis]|uniref:non-specific serine/threonine protein kinase n=1 Tax=Gloeocapsopsis dulcis AAB1 = 1H9 TaxID=1433147 RepID=A0A6N8FXG2_9CHRO|nr:serine/threonine-protein kinase [Gloeocapsopsis dulcis]MUL37015.1 serine/threonine protein kinase [Gloeocapsopsis dulcis AAB1 = 1H9]WNN87869.1 protein kinase [Gloeocapsopsis dulcis]
MTTLLNNRYQIIQLLGSGGFGETFLAEDTYMPSRRRCVIKQLKPVVNDPSTYQLIQQRFQREAATLEALGERSTQIPKLYAYFSEQGQFFLVQEWIHGQTLASKVATTGVLSENAVREILVSLLQVLDYVHSQGIIYRDIKPDNILLRESNNQPVLIDFGAVKETMATTINSQGKLTQTMVIGTPGFMSPEQAAGRPVYASDIYGLGLTAIYLLTGKLPQELETSQHEEILWQQYLPTISPKLAAVLNKAIQYHPRDRYTTAIKMLENLQYTSPTATTHEQTTLLISGTRQRTTAQRSQTPVIRYHRKNHNWQFLAIAGLLAGGLAVGVLANFRQAPQSSISNSTTPAEAIAEPSVESGPTPTASPSPTAPVASPILPPVESPASPPPLFPQLDESPPQSQELEEPSLAQSPLPNQEPPVETPPVPAPTALPQDNVQSAPIENIPAFPTGTSESQVRATLGNPTKTSRGVWGNTRAAIYDIKPNQVTLGYLFDRNSGRLQQTEVSFAQSVDPQIMQGTLQQLLEGNASAEVNEGLQQVYQRRTNRYSFTTGELKGVIERNNRDRIYIGVWESDLH